MKKLSFIRNICKHKIYIPEPYTEKHFTFCFCLYFTVSSSSIILTLFQNKTCGPPLILPFLLSTIGNFIFPTSGSCNICRRVCQIHLLIKPSIKLQLFCWPFPGASHLNGLHTSCQTIETPF